MKIENKFSYEVPSFIFRNAVMNLPARLDFCFEDLCDDSWSVSHYDTLNYLRYFDWNKEKKCP